MATINGKPSPKKSKEPPRSLTSHRKVSISIPSPSVNGSSALMKTPTYVLKTPNGSYSGDGMLDKPIHQRQISPSSLDQDMATESIIEVESQANPRKRGSNDTFDYPRRRATIACEICRGRKSRCDGAKPKCRLCSELHADCVYREPGLKLDAGDKLILERLNRIEGLLRTNILSQARSTTFIAESPATSNATSISREDTGLDNIGRTMVAIPVTGLGTWEGQQANISSMPKVHTTPALHLLQWPMIRDLVSRPYDPQHLLQLELSREPLQLGTSLSLDLSNTATYVQAFFDLVNVWYACVNPNNWTKHYQIALSHGFREGPESCIVLLVFALGCASMNGSISQIGIGQEPPGMPYFTAAWALLPAQMTRINMLSAQCMILASAYLFYLVRPLEAWTVLGSMNMKLQLLLSGQGRIPPRSKELSERVYWNALLFESDLLADLDLPHSGIVQFEEIVGLPCGFEEEDENPVSRDELWYFLAEIALRRLLNRVSQTIYSKGVTTSLTALDSLSAELDFQLTQWYESLPESLQFPYNQVPLANPVQTVLRLRYFACRTIIFRPYILAVLEHEQAILHPSVQDHCRKCLEASVRQLEHITAHRAGHLPYLWQGALSIVSQTLLVMGATMSQSLSALLPPPQQMDDIIIEVVIEIERYAHLAPSLRLSAEIIREAEQLHNDEFSCWMLGLPDEVDSDDLDATTDSEGLLASRSMAFSIP